MSSHYSLSLSLRPYTYMSLSLSRARLLSLPLSLSLARSLLMPRNGYMCLWGWAEVERCALVSKVLRMLTHADVCSVAYRWRRF